MNLLIFEFLVIPNLQLYYKPYKEKNQEIFSSLYHGVLKNRQKNSRILSGGYTLL